ncbi:DnaD domain protein, partial [Limosilactobacillus reuteri]|uniref:helix-turn-helix domain-containing protein n=1 Tax=Limosilactobacillus reuteri TaxID=1598 RepID=UPI000D6F2519
MEQPSYYSILTASVRYDHRLKNHADCKVLYSEITALSNKSGYCHATNKYFSKLYDRPVPTISKWINLLKDCGYLKIVMIKDGKQIKERRIYPISTPINVDVNTYSGEHEGGINAGVKPPINVDVKENITSINNTSTNNTSAGTQSASSENPFDLIHEHHINANEGDHLPIFLNAINQLGEPLVCWAIRQTAD